jgi:uncharacterized protein
MARLAHLVAALLVLFALAAPARAQPTAPPVPAHTGRVVDEAKVLDDTTRLTLDNRLASLEAKTGDQVVVVTLPSLHGIDIETYARVIAQRWVLGQPGKSNGGLLVLAPGQGKVAIQYSSGLADRINDATINAIIRTIIPILADDNLGGGMVRGVDEITAVLTRSGAPAVADAQTVPNAQPAPLTASGLPALTGRVVDTANILSSSARAELTAKLAAFEAKTTDQLVVATVRSLGGDSIENYANKLFREWKLGQKDKNNGVLLLVAPSERKVRIEVGYGLEGTLTDAISRFIIENSILPRFRANDYADGISRGANSIIDVLTGDPAEWKRRAAPKPPGVLDYSTDVVLFILKGLLLLVFAISLLALAGLVIYLPISWLVGLAIWLGWLPKRPKRSADNKRAGWINVFDPAPSSHSHSSGSSWSSSDSGGGFSGGGDSGGFSGGGGDSGGGGASGSW